MQWSRRAVSPWSKGEISLSPKESKGLAGLKFACNYVNVFGRAEMEYVRHMVPKLKYFGMKLKPQSNWAGTKEFSARAGKNCVHKN